MGTKIRLCISYIQNLVKVALVIFRSALRNSHFQTLKFIVIIETSIPRDVSPILPISFTERLQHVQKLVFLPSAIDNLLPRISLVEFLMLRKGEAVKLRSLGF